MRNTTAKDGFFIGINESGEIRTFEYVTEEEVISKGFSILRKASNVEKLKGYVEDYVRRNTGYIVTVKDGKFDVIEQLGPNFKAPMGAEIKAICSERATAEAYLQSFKKSVSVV